MTAPLPLTEARGPYHHCSYYNQHVIFTTSLPPVCTHRHLRLPSDSGPWQVGDVAIANRHAMVNGHAGIARRVARSMCLRILLRTLDRTPCEVWRRDSLGCRVRDRPRVLTAGLDHSILPKHPVVRRRRQKPWVWYEPWDIFGTECISATTGRNTDATSAGIDPVTPYGLSTRISWLSVRLNDLLQYFAVDSMNLVGIAP